ncbi:MAG: TIGR03618 family F420-dependent PPOX class oxidoreductase [Actinomycetota bacterium]|nr:TIGR03618 family F420-dependent PPOX class oxidoreductase [Actinomycetota bacterium]
MQLSPALAAFVAERHLATLVTLRADGTPHAVPVGFTIAFVGEHAFVRVITSAGAVKAANVRGTARASVTQIDGARWVTFEGPAVVLDDAATVAVAVEAYARRYRQPRERDDRVVIEIEVQRMMCNSGSK